MQDSLVEPIETTDEVGLQVRSRHAVRVGGEMSSGNEVANAHAEPDQRSGHHACFACDQPDRQRVQAGLEHGSLALAIHTRLFPPR